MTQRKNNSFAGNLFELEQHQQKSWKIFFYFFKLYPLLCREPGCIDKNRLRSAFVSESVESYTSVTIHRTNDRTQTVSHVSFLQSLLILLPMTRLF